MLLKSDNVFNQLRCPVCSSARVKQIYTGRDLVVTRFIGQRTVVLSLLKCRTCGMLFLGPLQYSPDVIHEAYWKMLIENISRDFSVDRWSQTIDLAKLDIYRKTNRILEIGCGDGFLLNYIREQGWQVTGIDFSRTAVALANDQYGLKVIEAELNEELAQELGPDSFDAIVMWGMIEHLTAPLEILRLSNILLRRGGAVVIYTPNADSIFHRLARTSYLGTGKLVKFQMERVIIAMHPLYFNMKTLQDVLKRSGFRVHQLEMVDIDLSLIFNAHRQFWWSKRIFFSLATLLQKLSHLIKMQSHLLAVAEKI